VRSYVYGSYVDELLAILPASGVVGERKFVHANHLYSVAALTDNTGAVVERYRYDAYGQRIVLAGDGVTLRWGSSHGNQVGFTGRYLDKETGLWYFRARYYSGSLGRFVNRDPLRYVDGMSLYRAYYVPNRLDPSGMFGDNWYGIGDPTLDLDYDPPPTPPNEWDIPDGSGGNVHVYADPGRDYECGKFKFEANDVRGRKYVHIKFDYSGCPCYYCSDIDYVQVVLSASFSGLPGLFENVNSPGRDYPSGEDPATSSGFMPENMEGGMEDSPSYTFFGLNAGFQAQFEVCAICKDDGKILGCMRWSVIGDSGGTTVPSPGGGPQPPSGGWRAGAGHTR